MKLKVLLFALVIAALVLSACGVPSTAPGETAPVVVRIGWTGEPDSLNPGVAWLAKAYTIYELVYDSMYDYNIDGTFSLSLADSVTPSADGLTYTYKIKEGVKWHDGQPMTAGDIAFTYNLVMTHTDFPTLNSYTTSFASVEAPDDTTVVLTLAEPVPSIESKLVFLYILPEHIWKDHAGLSADDTASGEAEPNLAAEFDNAAMIGTGAFKLKEFKSGEYVHLVANQEYFKTPAKVDEIIFQSFESADVLVQALKSGQVDMINELPPTSVSGLKNADNIKVVTGLPLSPDLNDIIFNLVEPENCPVDAGGLCTGHPALRDRTVRLAMAHATDKQKLIDVVTLGLATPGIALIPRGLGDWFNSSIQDYAYDVELANKLLDDSGYKDTDGDGIREMPNDPSKPLTFRLNWPNDSTSGSRMAELLDEMWTGIGIDTLPQAVDPDALTAQCCPTLDYDILLWGWVADPDPSTLLIIPRTDQIETGYNETGYSNPVYDDLFDQQSVELNRDTRKQIVWEMQRIIHEDVIYIIPYYSDAVQAYRTDHFTGWLTEYPNLMLEDPSSLMVIEPVK